MLPDTNDKSQRQAARIVGWLWFLSRLVPRPLATLGLVASVPFGIRSAAVTIFPEIGSIPPAVWAGPS